MLNEREVSAAIGTTAHGPDGDKLGTVEHFFVDDRTGRPTWVALTTGLFGTKHSIVPADEARLADGVLHLPVTRAQVRSAPPVADTEHLGPEEEGALRAHYTAGRAPEQAPQQAPQQATDQAPEQATDQAPERAVDDAAPTVAIPRGDADVHGRHAAVPGGAPEVAGRPAVPGHPARPDDGALTRSEEQLRVGHERVATRRARLVKYVVTEEVQVTVPLRREEVRLEYDDDTPAQAAGQPSGQPAGQAAGPGSGPAAGAGHGVPGSLVEQDTGGGLPDEIVLHAERPVVSVQVVPTERVRLRTEVVEGTEQVTEQLQREQVVVDEQPAPGHQRQHQPQQAGPHQQGGPYQQEVQRPGV